MTYFPEFAKLIEDALQQKDLTQPWLARRLDIHASTVNRWINEKKRPDSPETVTRIADALGLDRQQLLLAANYGYQEVAPSHSKTQAQERVAVVYGSPPLPKLLIGRQNNIDDLHQLLTSPNATPRLIAMVGWPGVGKTSLAAALAHEPRLRLAFPNGVLWTALGEKPSILSALGEWLLALKENPQLYPTPEGRSHQLRTLLQDAKMLLIIDDVWDAAAAEVFLVGGRDCRTLITTREPEVVRDMGIAEQATYRLPVLTDDEALELLMQLAPTVVTQEPPKTLRLVKILEGLPLALQVAGRLLAEEVALGWGVGNLLDELIEGTRLMAEKAPSDRTNVATQTTPTIAVLLKKSTDRLSPLTRKHFALLGAFVSKPATFDLAATNALLQLADSRPTLRTLVRRGLLEPTEGGRFQMHSLLTVHARELLKEAV